uniref:Uncharacterized protein n=1 Tax=Oryza sativa subsp. japonica TaxID=39947 RepID=Q339E4_ORYSJ|nr:hypothetical protein LOC_Os10g21770 [Oryza sativa Japonica Group]
MVGPREPFMIAVIRTSHRKPHGRIFTLGEGSPLPIVREIAPSTSMKKEFGKACLGKKYLTKKQFCKSKKDQGTRIFWASLMLDKESFQRIGSFLIQDGSRVRFWEDCWIGVQSFEKEYPNLYSLVRNKNEMVAKVIFMGTLWARTWPLLLKGVDEEMVKSYCKLLEKRALEFFSMYGGNIRRILEACLEEQF